MPFKDHDLNKTLQNLRQMENEVERLLKDFFVSKNPLLMMSEKGWVPHMDVYETAEAFIIKVELAGVKKEDVKIQLVDRTLVLTGKRDDLCEELRQHFHVAEISYGPFLRKIELPSNVNFERIEARFRDGFLRIHVPKSAEAPEGPFTISISEDNG